MPARTQQPIPVRLTDEQRAWLDQQAARLDRPLAWVIRALIDTMMRENRPIDPLPAEKNGAASSRARD